MRIELHLHGNEYFYDFRVFEFVWLNGKFDFKGLGNLKCHDVGLLKSAAPCHFPGKALYVRSKSGDSYYYHPRYKRWFKNLSDKSLDLFFSWLKPDKGLDKNLRRESARLTQEVLNE